MRRTKKEDHQFSFFHIYLKSPASPIFYTPISFVISLSLMIKVNVFLCSLLFKIELCNSIQNLIDGIIPIICGKVLSNLNPSNVCINYCQTLMCLIFYSCKRLNKNRDYMI